MAFTLSLQVPHTIKQRGARSNVVFIEKTKLIVVVLPEKTIREFTYPQEMVTDGDVMKKDEFRTALAQWIDDSHIKPADTLCVVAVSAIFEKSLVPRTRSRGVDTQLVTAYIEAIPFQHVVTVKRTEKDGSVTVLVANRDLLVSVYQGFDKAGCNVTGVYPEIAPVLEHATPIIQGDAIDRARKHLDYFGAKESAHQEFDVLPQDHRGLANMSVAEAAQQPVQPWVAVAIVMVLVAGAFGVGYFQYYQARQEQITLARKRTQLLAQQQSVDVKKDTQGPQQVSAHTTPPPQDSTPSATITQSASPSATTAISPTNTVLKRVQIVYTAEAQKLFDDVYNLVRQSGEYQISNQSTSREINVNRVLLAPGLDAETTAHITAIVESVGIETISKEAEIDGYDMVIELGVYTPSAPPTSTPQPSP